MINISKDQALLILTNAQNQYTEFQKTPAVAPDQNGWGKLRTYQDRAAKEKLRQVIVELSAEIGTFPVEDLEARIKESYSIRELQIALRCQSNENNQQALLGKCARVVERYARSNDKLLVPINEKKDHLLIQAFEKSRQEFQLGREARHSADLKNAERLRAEQVAQRQLNLLNNARKEQPRLSEKLEKVINDKTEKQRKSNNFPSFFRPEKLNLKRTGQIEAARTLKKFVDEAMTRDIKQDDLREIHRHRETYEKSDALKKLWEEIQTVIQDRPVIDTAETLQNGKQYTQTCRQVLGGLLVVRPIETYEQERQLYTTMKL